MRITSAIFAGAMALGTMVMVASPASAQFVTTGGRIPAGSCVIDIATRVAKQNARDYIHPDTAKDPSGARNGYALGYWDVSIGAGSDRHTDSGFMNMSVKIGKIADGQCLTDVVLRFATAGNPPAPAKNDQDENWDDRGGWASPHFWQSTGNGKAFGIVYQQKMNSNSKQIVTGITMLYGGPCGPNCLGTWKGQGGGDKYYQLAIAKTNYTPPPEPKPVKVAGKWSQISSCSGCSETGFEIKYGKTEGKEVGKESEAYRSLSLALGASYTAGTGATAPAQSTVSVSATLTGTISDTRRESILNSVSQSVEATTRITCTKGAVWQWLTEVTYDVGFPTKGRSNIYVCTGTDKVPPTGAGGVDWTGQ